VGGDEHAEVLALTTAARRQERGVLDEDPPCVGEQIGHAMTVVDPRRTPAPTGGPTPARSLGAPPGRIRTYPGSRTPARGGSDDQERLRPAVGLLAVAAVGAGLVAATVPGAATDPAPARVVTARRRSPSRRCSLPRWSRCRRAYAWPPDVPGARRARARRGPLVATARPRHDRATRGGDVFVAADVGGAGQRPSAGGRGCLAGESRTHLTVAPRATGRRPRLGHGGGAARRSGGGPADVAGLRRHGPRQSCWSRASGVPTTTGAGNCPGGVRAAGYVCTTVPGSG
jgi:hypothetical protein